jgi:hypothetical protein
MPSPRETIALANFDAVTRAMLLAVFDDVWASCTDRSELIAYRIAGSIIDAARAGQRSEEAIHRYAAEKAECRS